jgi:hypothetical protein
VEQLDRQSFQPLLAPPQQSTLVHSPQPAWATCGEFLERNLCRRLPLTDAFAVVREAICVSAADPEFKPPESESIAIAANAKAAVRIRMVFSIVALPAGSAANMYRPPYRVPFHNR